jgi:hypothetical protein
MDSTLYGTETRPAVRLERWFGHGIDIGIKLDRGQVTFIARDVLEAMGLDLDWTEGQPDRTATGKERALHCTTWELERLTVVLEALGTRDALALIDWAASKVDEFTQAGTDSIERASLPNPEPITTLGPDDHAAAAPTDELPEWYSVSDAAAILSRDPAISIGQGRLFEWMRTRGWVTRPAGVWEPSRDLTANGWLKIITRKIRNTKQIYPQVCITPLGLQKLHEFLGGTATIHLQLTDPELTEEKK